MSSETMEIALPSAGARPHKEVQAECARLRLRISGLKRGADVLSARIGAYHEIQQVVRGLVGLPALLRVTEQCIEDRDLEVLTDLGYYAEAYVTRWLEGVHEAADLHSMEAAG